MLGHNRLIVQFIAKDHCYYVMGNGFHIPCDSKAEAEKTKQELENHKIQSVGDFSN